MSKQDLQRTQKTTRVSFVDQIIEDKDSMLFEGKGSQP